MSFAKDAAKNRLLGELEDARWNAIGFLSEGEIASIIQDFGIGVEAQAMVANGDAPKDYGTTPETPK